MSEAYSIGSNEREQVPFKNKLIYALGQLPGGFYGSFTGQIQMFYFGWMGLSWEFILVTQILYAIWNAVNDPIFGVLQDRTRTKNGRYIPWIKWAAPFFTVAFIALFFPSQSWAMKTGGSDYQLVLGAWYLFSQMIYDTGFTIVYIAHVSLAPQMTMSQKERTDIQILSTIMSTIGAGLSSAFPLIFLIDANEEKIRMFQTSVVIVAIIGFIPWILIVKYLKERPEFIPPKEKQSSFWQNVKFVFKNPSGWVYVLYDGFSVGIITVLLTGISFVFEWVFGIKEEFNPGGGVEDIIWYLIPILIGFILGVIIEYKITLPKAQKGFGKDVKFALMYSLSMEAVGFLIAYLGVKFSTNLRPDILLVPNGLWAVSLGLGIAFLGFPGDFLYHNVMRADTIDYDELLTGERRESVYAGVGCLFSKPMISVALVMVPFFMTLYGLTSATIDDPTESRLIATDGFANATLGVATGVFLFPAILAMLGIIFWVPYPLTGKKLVKLREDLEVLHKQKREERL